MGIVEKIRFGFCVKSKNLLIMLLCVALLIISVSGCKPKRYQDITNSISPELLSTPAGEYRAIAWLDEDRIAFIYKPQELVRNELGQDFRVGVFELTSGKSKDMPLPDVPDNCNPKTSGVSELAKVPNDSLGFIYSCWSSGDTLYLLEPSTEDLIKWVTYLGVPAKNFSFSPDMSQLIQEDGSGGGLSEKLLLVSPDKSIHEFLHDFQRARSPAWSPDGETIVFAGTKKQPENIETSTLQGINDLFFYPWDIYITDENGENPEILLPSFGTIYDLKWSPVDENLILFGGTSFDNVDGVWLLDISDTSIKRVWSKNTLYDWSPDGARLVLLDNDTGDWWSSITIIDVFEQ